MKFNRALTTNQVRSIRAKASKGSSQAELARQFGVSPRTIGRVVSGEHYSHVESTKRK